MNRARRRNEAKLDKSTIINAAALQDHLARSITLDLHLPPRQPRKPVVDTREKLTTRSASNSEYRCVWVCDSCTFENDERPHSSTCGRDSDRCSACGTQRSQQLRPRLTLAQKRGLVTRPPPKLTRDEWEHCEQQAEARGDTQHPCSICREPFGVREQVILSCSHMFHLACITSFERFLRTNQRVCPLCRKQDYQKRATTMASAFHREYSAKRIQAVFRGFSARRQVASLWQKFYSSGKGDPVRRRRFFASRVGKTADRLVTAMSKRDDSIDALLAEFDKSLSMSRRVFQDHVPETDTDPGTGSSFDGDDWLAIFSKAKARDESECAICINSFSSSMTGVSLLSCSHAFHSQCLSAFEDFNIYEVSLCPVCRASYRAQTWLHVAQIASQTW
ncbi:RING finger protein 32-like [Phytophthora cinnamomi]|uniref:RING finger protein 32-like n=1 Tax=Phytophthora cinnamomi TaxID=4785 RepID=UPI003559A641|nr:RING finger protein 32-like [Phytophthora cinnamomi]